MPAKPNEYTFLNPNILTRDVIVRLSKTDQFRSILNLFWSLFVCFLAIALAQHFKHPALYLVAIVLIGSRMQALSSMAHDGSHYMLFRNKKLNDWIVDLFIFWPIFHTLHIYRKDHYNHHQFLNSSNDPDYSKLSNYKEYQFPKSKTRLLLLLLLDLIGFNFLYYSALKLFKPKGSHQQFNIQPNSQTTFYNLYRVLYYLALLIPAVLFGYWKLLLFYWLVPAFTWYSFISRIRTISEHFCISSSALFGTRTLLLNRIEKFFVIPYGLNYHVEHHLYPSVPFYRLHKLHHYLKTTAEYQANAHVTKGLWGLLKECTRS